MLTYSQVDVMYGSTCETRYRFGLRQLMHCIHITWSSTFPTLNFTLEKHTVV
jgi:hypothetical protein